MAIVWQKSALAGGTNTDGGRASNTEKGCPMRVADPTALRPPAAKQLASIRAYRKTGCAIVTVERAHRTPHRHRVSLRRYAALREWTLAAAPRRWKTSGAWLHSSIAVSLWEVLAWPTA